jgi:hypothetical protein
MKGSPASRRQHQRFCQIEGWAEVRSARGTATQHHITDELTLADGRVLRTRISRPANNTPYGRGLWSHILTDQLQVTAEQFWDCVHNGKPPQRARPSAPPSDARTLPASLAHQLVHMLQLTSDEVARVTLDEAVQRMKAHWEGREA